MVVRKDSPGATSQRGLNFLWLELTSRCNLQCVHCYADSGPKRGANDKLQQLDYEELLAQAAQLGCRQVQFIGGEPTLVPYLGALIARARALGYEFVEVFTNGTHLSEELLDMLEHYNVSVAMSFYSSDEGVHESITKVRGSYRATIDGIRKVQQRTIPLRVGVIVMRENGDSNEATRTALEEMGVTEVGFDRVREFGRAANDSPEELSNLCGRCWQGSLAISPDGAVAPCIMSKNWPVGSVRSNTLSNILGSDEIKETRKLIHDHFSTTETACGPNCNPHCQPTCPPNCSPTCGPIACQPRGCWPAFQ